MSPRATTVPQGTKLDQVIDGISGRPSFHNGTGVDAMTGALCANALQPFELKPGKSTNSVETHGLIEDTSTLSQEIEASASGKYNIEGVTISASTKYLQSLEFSDTTTTLLASYTVQGDENAVADNYALTNEAKQLLAKDAKKFRDVYGDYFVAGGLMGGRFVATYVCKAKSKKSMDEFKASLGIEVPDVFSADGSTKFKKAVSEHGVNLTVNVSALGEDPKKPFPTPSEWTPAEVLKALAWFKANMTGAMLRAELRHYSTVDNTCPRMVDVQPDVFVTLRLLYLDLWEARARYAALPDYYHELFRKQYEALDTGITANQERLALDRALMEDYQNQLNLLLKQFQDVDARMDFYARVQSEVPREPAKGKVIQEQNGEHSWQYGFSSDPRSNAVAIKTQSVPFKKTSTGGGYWEETVDISVPNCLIVGWRATSNWTDGTGGTFSKASNQILLTDKASVHFCSLWGRGCDWVLDVYYVDAKEYQFDEVRLAMAAE
jgi:hypothetical protein